MIEEISLLPLSAENLEFRWPGETDLSRRNLNIFVFPTVPESVIEKLKAEDHGASRSRRRYHRITVEEAAAQLMLFSNESQSSKPLVVEGSPFPRFDLGIINSLEELDAVIRPDISHSKSLIRARGAILLLQSISSPSSLSASSRLAEAVATEGLSLHTSRCGDLRRTLALLASQPEIARNLEEKMITHQFPLSELAEGFEMARNSEESIKVVVETTGEPIEPKK